MSKRIGYLIPGTGLEDAEHQRRDRILSQLARAGTCIELVEVDEGPPSIESEADEQAAIPYLVELAEARQGDYDGYIIGCYSDLGIHQIRESVSMPVVGPVRASFSTAAAAFGTFSIVTINHEVIPILERQVQQLGFSEQCMGIGAVNIGVLEIINNPERAHKRFVDSLGAVQTHAVVPGCMSYAYLLAERQIGRIGDVHIINPLTVSVSMAEAMVN